jgi:hypothetical protein
MQYWLNCDTGHVTARDFEDPPFGDLWIEIDREEYEQLVHPLTPPDREHLTALREAKTPTEYSKILEDWRRKK